MEYQDADQTRRMKSGDVTFGYNVLGLSRLTPGPTSQAVRFVRDNNRTLVSQRDGGTEQSSYYLFDGRGSVAGLTNSQGSLIGGDSYRYTPTGTPVNDPLSGTGVSNPWKFAAGFHSAATGLYKFGTRYYDPGIMRWTQQDPNRGNSWDPMSLNPYLYVGDNPANGTDPTGLYLVAGGGGGDGSSGGSGLSPGACPVGVGFGAQAFVGGGDVLLGAAEAVGEALIGAIVGIFVGLAIMAVAAYLVYRTCFAD